MWNDIETTDDLLNFKINAEVAAQLIIESEGKPLSIGISGNWGTGKSSLVKMIGKSIEQESQQCNKFIFLEFNAWLYQGYEDARTALLQSVSEKLLETARKDKNSLNKARDFAKRINWLNLGKLAAPVIANAAMGFSVGGPLVAFAAGASSLIMSGKMPSEQEWNSLCCSYNKLSPKIAEILEGKKVQSMPKEIQALRNSFENTLKALNKTLVVLVDDMDRCLPTTAISTLEAMRLLLFVSNTAFVIAVDEDMIRNAVRSHFGKDNISDDMVKSYFDKLIQVPLRVPRLGISDVKAYVALLLAEQAVHKGILKQDVFEDAKKEILKATSNSWKAQLSRSTLEKAFKEKINSDYSIIDIAEQTAHLLTTTRQIAGNPRLIKRFLNDLMIHRAVATKKGITVTFESLVKIKLFERCAPSSAFEYLYTSANRSDNGKIIFLNEIEHALAEGKDYKAPDKSWDDPFISEWVKLEPKFGDTDIRPLLHLSRDKGTSLAAYDELSHDAQEVFNALLETDDDNKTIQQEISKISVEEAQRLFDRIARKAENEQYSVEALKRAINIPAAYPQLSQQYINLLKGIPPEKRLAPLIPILGKYKWAKEILEMWNSDPATPEKVKKSINTIIQGGN